MRAAVTVGDDTLSRDELDDAAGGIAAALLARDRPGPVAVHADASLDTVLAVVGGLRAGVPVVPVPPDSGPAEREHVLGDSGAVAWIGPDELGGGLPALSVDGLRRSATIRDSDPVASTDRDATALVLYTSGTTGLPKGVEISSHALTTGIDALAQAWQWTADDTLVHGLPLFHLHGLVLGVLGALRVGSPVVHTIRPTPSAYAAAAGSLYFAVPTVWHRVAQDRPSAEALRGARLLVSGSAPLPVGTFAALHDLTGHQALERYGMTETGITLSARADEERRAGWVGRAVGRTEARLRDEHGGLAPADGATVGRLEVRGPTLFRGYLRRPEATAESFTDDGWFVTGDLAVVDAEGRHRIVGRESTDLIKSGGYRIGAGEIEAVIREHPGVDDVAVVGRPDDDLGQRIVAYVVAERSPGLEQQLVELVGARLSWHKRPREVVVVDDLPRNPMGKVQKALLA